MSTPPADCPPPSVVEFPIRRNIVFTCCFLIMLLGVTSVLLHEIERLPDLAEDGRYPVTVNPRVARDTFLTVGVAVDVLSAVFVFLWTWIFSPFRCKRLYQLLPLFLVPGCLCLAAVLCWELHGATTPANLHTLGFPAADADADATATATATAAPATAAGAERKPWTATTAEEEEEEKKEEGAEYVRGPFQIAALVSVGLALAANVCAIVSVFVYTFDCRYCAYYDHSVYRYGNMRFNVRRISTVKPGTAVTVV